VSAARVTVSGMSAPEQGWLEDPERPGAERWWTGTEWGDFRRGSAAPRKRPWLLIITWCLAGVSLIGTGALTYALIAAQGSLYEKVNTLDALRVELAD